MLAHPHLHAQPTAKGVRSLMGGGLVTRNLWCMPCSPLLRGPRGLVHPARGGQGNACHSMPGHERTFPHPFEVKKKVLTECVHQTCMFSHVARCS